MGVKVEPLTIPGLLIVTPDRFGDDRGFFSETFNTRAFAEVGIRAEFVQDNQSLSRMKGTVRGLHFQRPPAAQAKLVRCLRGAILDVAVDLRQGSPTYGQHAAVELTPQNWRQLFVPEGFAHGFCTLEPDTEIAYKVSGFYAPDCDDGIHWKDKDLAISWPDFAGANLSPKDQALQKLSAFSTPFRYRSQI